MPAVHTDSAEGRSGLPLAKRAEGAAGRGVAGGAAARYPPASAPRLTASSYMMPASRVVAASTCL